MPKPPQHPLHTVLMRLHEERRKLLLQLELAALKGEQAEDIVIAISNNRWESREVLKFLADEVATRPGTLTEFGALDA